MLRCCITFLLFVCTSVVADTVSKQLAQCANIKNDTERLQCFDLLVQQTQSITNNPIATIENPNKTPIEASKPPLSKASGVENFGQEHKNLNQQALNEIILVLSDAKKNLRKKWILTFDNGQVWQQTDTEKWAKFEAGDTVIIRRGVFNSFSAKKQGTNRMIRVRRIQ
jgi:hypothetical protein